MELRTDLAIESIEYIDDDIPEVKSCEYSFCAGKVTKTKIKTQNAAIRIGKPTGEYITAEIPDILSGASADTKEISEILASEISALLPENLRTALIIGLGNRAITPDALGPQTAENIIATRHIPTELLSSLDIPLKTKVAVISPGVLGQTGIESGEILLGVCKEIRPEAVIAVDALTAGDIKRLCRTVQISNTGITPGSGVNNARFEISKKSLGMPVIAIGIPTVTSTEHLLKEKSRDNLIITPSNIDSLISFCSQLLSAAINKALNPEIPDDIIDILS